jgi:hypothetical protein
MTCWIFPRARSQAVVCADAAAPAEAAAPAAEAVATPPAIRPAARVPPASAAIGLRDRQRRSEIEDLGTRISECLHHVKTRPDAGLASQT